MNLYVCKHECTNRKLKGTLHHCTPAYSLMSLSHFPPSSLLLLNISYPAICFQCFFSLLALCLSTIWPYCSHNRISHSKSSHFTLHLNSECFLMQLFFFLENTSSGVSKESVWTPSQEKQRVGRVLIYFLASNTNMIGTGGCLISLYFKR